MRYWIEPRKENGIWQLCWTENRVKRTKSIGTRDEIAAAQWFEQYKAELDRPAEEKPTVKDVLEFYLNDKSGLASAGRNLQCAQEINKRLGSIEVGRLHPRHARKYAQDRGIKPGAVIRELAILRAALQHAVKEQVITAAPFVPVPSIPKPRDRWLTRKEGARLLEECRQTPHLHLFVLLALHTAARSGAILDLKWTQVDWSRAQIDYGHGTGNKGRAVVPMTKLLIIELQDARQAATIDNVIEFNGKPVKSIKKAFKRACDRAGLEDVTPHDLRRTSATWAAENGVPMRKIARMLGHDDERTTEKVYSKHTPDYLKEFADAIEGDVKHEQKFKLTKDA